MIRVTDLIEIDRHPSGGWRLHVRKDPAKRPKVTHYQSLELVLSRLLEMRVSDCRSLEEIPALLADFRRDIVAQIVRQAPKREFNDLTPDERLVLLSRARVSTVPSLHDRDGKFEARYLPRVAGMALCVEPMDGDYDTREAALETARLWRGLCRDKAKQAGLI